MTNRKCLTTVEKIVLSHGGAFTLPDIQARMPGERNQTVTRSLFRMQDEQLIEQANRSLNGRTVWQLTAKGRELAKASDGLRVISSRIHENPKRDKEAIAANQVEPLPDTRYPAPGTLTPAMFYELCNEVDRIYQIINRIKRNEEMAAWMRYSNGQPKTHDRRKKNTHELADLIS